METKDKGDFEHALTKVAMKPFNNEILTGIKVEGLKIRPKPEALQNVCHVNKKEVNEKRMRYKDWLIKYSEKEETRSFIHCLQRKKLFAKSQGCMQKIVERRRIMKISNMKSK